MEEFLALAKGRCQQAEVFRVWRRETSATFEANRLKSLQTKETSGASLRVIKDGRIGFAATSNLSDPSWLVDRALELSSLGALAKFHLPGPKTYPQVRLYDEETESISFETMAELGQGMIDIVRRVSSELVCEAYVTKSLSIIEILNSQGGYASYQKTVFALGLEATRIRDGDMLFLGDHRSSSSPILDFQPITDTVLEQMELAKETVPAPSGHVPVLFTPVAVASALLWPLVVALNGRTVVQGTSPLEGRLGQQVFDRRLSLWDDPTIDLVPGSRIADDEGVPCRRTSLVDQGVPVAFLYDLQTAGLAGTESTGSASRALGSLPSPSISVLAVGLGDAAFPDIIAGLKEGLLVDQLLGAGQSNILGGEFGGNVLLGYRIQNGEVVGRVKDTVIAGNVYDVLKKVVAIGDEARWVMGMLSTPPICCDGVAVSSKT